MKWIDNFVKGKPSTRPKIGSGPIDRITGVTAEDFGLDEIVATGVSFHMERMDGDYMWFVISDGTREQHVDMYAYKNKLYVHVRDQEQSDQLSPAQ